MKTLMLVLAIAATTNAHAISRYYSHDFTCVEAKQTVKDEGAVIFRYPSTRVPGLMLYDRYVANSNYCYSGESAERAYVPTADTNKCMLYNCKRIDRN